MAENVNPTISEYDAFGPWAYEIDDANPLPPLFVPCFASNDDAILKIKIPRDIDRRNAVPGMNLYDFVIALYEDKLRVLERQDDKVNEHQITAKEFRGIRFYENLLKGGCTIFSAGGAVSFPYNTVSGEMIRKFADLVIGKLQEESEGSAYDTSSLPETKAKPEAMLLNNLLHDLQMKTPDISVGALQKSIDVFRNDSAQSRIERLLWKETNPEAIHLYTKKELVILENGSFPNRAGLQELGYTCTILPINQIGSIEITDSREYASLKECVLSLGSNRIIYHFGADNKEVAAFYNAVNALRAV